MENLNDIKNTILEIDPSIKIYVGKYVPLNLNEFNKNNNYLAFSGIGNHKTFISMLKKNNFKVIKDIEFPDHYEYSKSDIDQIISVSKDIDCKIITTEKDSYRLDKFNLDQIKVLKSELEIINEKEFLETLDMIYE
jgi:tetraacyldisaccharide 4'-kinase